jgi:hypothetical protein
MQHAIEQTFLRSWDEIETLYHNDEAIGGWLWILPMRQIIHDLRKLGYDRHLRANQVMLSLILSRSIQPTLQAGQASVAFTLFRDNTMEVRFYSTQEEITYEFNHTQLDVKVESLLEKLLNQPIT